MSAGSNVGWRRAWVYPMVMLTGIAFTLFAALYCFDLFVSGGPASAGDGAGLARYVFFDPETIPDAVSALGAMVAGVLGITISVVAIVVQLSAERYTGVTAMFFRDRTNMSVLGFYVVSCVFAVWVSMSLRTHFAPRATLVTMMLVTTASLVLMAPYYAYVFRFLEPTNIIARIRHDAVNVARRGSVEPGREGRKTAQAGVIAAMEELTDITSNSIEGKDKIIASRAVDALKDLALAYLQFKPQATAEWFAVDTEVRDHPDFVAMDPESLEDLVARKTWLEWKMLRQFMGIYNDALHSMRDINYLVAIDTRYVGEAAVTAGDTELAGLVVRFMNSYLRATLNARDVRTCYNVLNQYRLLIEAMLRDGKGAMAKAAVEHLKYYAHVSYEMKLPFVTETIAYDVGALCQLAHDLAAHEEAELLEIFLKLDRPGHEDSQDQALRGVRKAQVKLAAYYVAAGQDAQARRIQQDMQVEPEARLRTIRLELERVDTKDFWEITDRGRNFEYMPPAQRAAMEKFFGWFA